jgi:hypothetical protein
VLVAFFGAIAFVWIPTSVEEPVSTFCKNDGARPAALLVRTCFATAHSNRQLLPVEQVSGNCMSPFQMVKSIAVMRGDSFQEKDVVRPIVVEGNRITKISALRLEVNHVSAFQKQTTREYSLRGTNVKENVGDDHSKVSRAICQNRFLTGAVRNRDCFVADASRNDGLSRDLIHCEK